MKPTLSIIIVNDRSSQALEHCLRSLHIGSTVAAEVIVVDRDPEQTARAIVKAAGHQMLYVPHDARGNWAMAANLGVHHAHGDALCFLDPHTMVTTGAIDRLANWVRQRPSTVVGPRQLDADGQPRISARPFMSRRHKMWPALATVSWPASWQYWLHPLVPNFRYARICQRATHPTAVEVLEHSCVMMDRATWTTVGPWAESLVGYGLESEWFARAREQGIIAWYLPSTTVVIDDEILRGQNQNA